MKGHITCTICPVGCRISVKKDGNEYVIEGNKCARGKQYAIDELINPTRILTTSIKVNGGSCELASVRTSGPIDLSIIREKMKEIKQISVDAPVSVGQVIVKDIDGKGVSLIATREVPLRRSETTKNGL
ncbi:MAG TPA: molybdopterin oxidoreductase [Kosmotogaceae bacterium]|nr:MAG: Uncharacterized protein XE05_0325 [Thermotogales bacterium 46_20]HAA85439.1 molybdopterin oxidoreductase [Kosmotogaceae bacterium]